MMKAIILQAFGGTDNFKLTEVDKPHNPKGNVLIKIKATAFNPIDYLIRQGAMESKLLKSFILGWELAGIICDPGQTESFSVGDAVVAYVGSLGSNGTYAEFISVPVELVAKKQANLSFEEACAIPLAGLAVL